MDLFRRVPVGNGWWHGRHAWVNPIVTADAPKPRPIQGLISAWFVAFSLHSCAAPCVALYVGQRPSRTPNICASWPWFVPSACGVSRRLP